MFKFLFFVVLLSGFQSSQCFDDHINPVVFYDLKTREPLQPPIIKILPGSENESFNMSSVINIRLPFIGQPCKFRYFTEVFLKFPSSTGGCESFTCGCCAGMMIEQFNFDQQSKKIHSTESFQLPISCFSVHEFHLRSNGICDFNGHEYESEQHLQQYGVWPRSTAPLSARSNRTFTVRNGHVHQNV